MRESQGIEWTRTRLSVQERDALLETLTSEQRAHLASHDYVWGRDLGVLWNPPRGEALRRARFTHGIHFETRNGMFYADSEGGVRELLPEEPIEGESTQERETCCTTASLGT